MCWYQFLLQNCINCMDIKRICNEMQPTCQFLILTSERLIALTTDHCIPNLWLNHLVEKTDRNEEHKKETNAKYLKIVDKQCPIIYIFIEPIFK